MNGVWTIKAKVLALSGFLLATLLVVSIVAETNTVHLTTQLKELANTQMPALRTMTLADMMHDGIRANVYRSIVSSGSKDPGHLKEITEERDEFAANISKYMDELSKLDLSAETKQAIAPAIPQIQAYTATAHAIVELAVKGQAEEATRKLPEFDEKFSALEHSLEKLGELIEANAREAQVKKVADAENANVMGIVLVIAGLFFGTVSSFLFIRHLQKTLQQVIGRLGEESRSVDETAGSLRNASLQLSDSSHKQASALQETASCVEEITAMVNKTAENSRHLETSANQSTGSAARGREAVQQMLEAISAIQESQQEITGQMEKGNEKITEIVKVITEIGQKTKVINDIVFQTKLLSFNASVEAARAGEHGKGFSVVAEEVGNLAQMSGNAAKEISAMLDTSTERVGGIVRENRSAMQGLIDQGKAKISLGVEVAQSCGTALNEIVNQVSEESKLIREITTAIKEQNQGIHEISKAIQLMDTSTQENSVLSREAAGLSDSLLKRSSSLGQMVVEMKLLIEGQPKDQPFSPPAEAVPAGKAPDAIQPTAKRAA